MILVDTSILIDYLRGRENEPARRFQYVLDRNLPFGISSVVYQEVLQGVKSERDFQTVKRYLETQRFYGLKDEKESYAAAAQIYLKCRKKGITIYSTIDSLIAQTAIENNLFLLHNDSDFDRMHKVIGLKMFNI
jgi:predicted nucleic acid-binding protein